jgi:hypothetical protein
MTFRIYNTKLIIRILIFSSLGLILAINLFFLTLTVDFDIIGFLLLITMLGGLFFLLSVFVVRRIVVTERGLEYRTIFNCTFKSWDDIKFIGLGWYPYRTLKAPLLIYFAEGCDSDPDGTYAIARAFIRVFYRKEIVEEILKYYDGEIVDAQYGDGQARDS